jgi:energy-coupling factor transporter transmembrane protein EcfT
MSVMTARPAATGALLARLNPVTKIGIAFAITATALVVNSTAVLLGLLLIEVAAIAISGVRITSALRRLLAITGFSLSVVLLNALGSSRPGAVVLQLGWIQITDAAVAAGGVAGLRVAVILIPSALLMVTIDPTDLADALAQRLRLPHRFVLGALAATRLAQTLSDDWRLLEQARRARGCAPDKRLDRLRQFPSLVFGLLVSALRHGGRMAVAMEARGLSPADRTWVRESRFGTADRVVSVVVVLMCVIGVLAARG